MRFWRKGPGGPAAAEEALPASLATPLSHRQFLKLVLGAVGGAGLGMGAAAKTAQATYIPGPPDVIDTNLEVQGNLIVDPSGTGKVGVGIASPAGRLDVAGAIRVNGAVAIDSAGVAHESYYAQ